MEKAIRVTCDTKLFVPLTELREIQGSLKEMTKENFVRLRKSILEDGFNFPVFVWKGRGPGEKKDSQWVLDGHGRLHVVRHLVAEEGFECHDLPCVAIQAPDFSTAKRKVLSISSQYNTMTNDGLYQFMSDLELGIESLDAYHFDVIDVPEFKMEYFDEPAPVATEGETKQEVSFDAYKNAAVKQIVLYYAAADYEKILKGLDHLMGIMAVEDYSQVVWRLLDDALRSKP